MTGKPQDLSGRNRLAFDKTTITAVILAGGEAKRMGGIDKGLVDFRGRPLIAHVIERVSPQVGSLLLNANSERERYAQFGYPVLQDRVAGFAGPLAGVHAALGSAQTPWLFVVACDMPAIPRDVVRRLWQGLNKSGASIAVAHDGTRQQTACFIMRTELGESVQAFLDKGDRKLGLWINEQVSVTVDFSDQPGAFANLNTMEELAAATG